MYLLCFNNLLKLHNHCNKRNFVQLICVYPRQIEVITLPGGTTTYGLVKCKINFEKIMGIC